jgi:hypothetical protein
MLLRRCEKLSVGHAAERLARSRHHHVATHVIRIRTRIDHVSNRALGQARNRGGDGLGHRRRT